jgi:MarR family transcriptional regulator, organic hydroperoxide resistance regulator
VTTDDPLTLDHFLCFAVYAASHAFNRVYKPLLEGLGLTYPQYLTMAVLWEQDDQTVGSLGEKLFLESSTLTPLLKRLEAGGYIARSRDPADERQVRVRLTAAGKSLKAKASVIPRCVLEATSLSPRDLSRLRTDLEKLRRALDAYEQV